MEEARLRGARSRRPSTSGLRRFLAGCSPSWTVTGPSTRAPLTRGRSVLAIPPVLSVVLDRAASRGRIPAILEDLRDEWSEARATVWGIVDTMKQATTLLELNDLRRQLTAAAHHFSPNEVSDAPRPVRVLWNVLADAAAGAITASIADGSFAISVAVGAVRAVSGAAAKALPAPARRPRRGAFDLAARVRRGVMQVEPMPALLSRFLTIAEKQRLGL